MTQHVADNISQLKENAQAFHTRLDTVRTGITAQESTAYILQCPSKRIRAHLESLSQDHDVVERNVTFLKDTLSRYRAVQPYRNDLVVAHLHKDQGEAARGLESGRQRICGVEDNIRLLEQVIDFIDHTRGED